MKLKQTSKAVILLAFFLSLTSICSCTNSNRAPYNALARAKHLTVEHSGYVIGFEKMLKGKLTSNHRPYQDLIRVPERLAKLENLGYSRFFNNQLTGDPKSLIPTHIASFKDDKADYRYNAYRSQPRSNGAGISEINALDHLDRFEEHLAKRLLSEDISHIIVMCMGWNNDQHDAIYRYNTIISNLKSTDSNRDFKPLVIDVTWPSVWLSRKSSKLTKRGGHLLSVINKRNDADELGVSYLNLLINKIIPSAQPKSSKPLVLIGHSYGAVALSRALHSREYLCQHGAQGSDVDMFIGLQPAFSINRYLKEVKRSEKSGHSYVDVPASQTKIILTASEYDLANNFTGWAKLDYAGGKKGISIARNNTTNDINYVDLVNSKKLNKKARKGIPLIVNASNFIQGEPANKMRDTPEISAHNDILDKDMSTFIHSCLDQLIQ